VEESFIMSAVNIGGDAKDPHYRYKRSVIQIKYETANGQQTRILNLNKISGQLCSMKDTKRATMIKKELVLTMKKTLGLAILTQKARDDTVLIKGSVDVARLEDIINLNILCPRCKLPELDSGGRKGACRSCDWSSQPASRQDVKGIEYDSKEEDDLQREISTLMKELDVMRDQADKDDMALAATISDLRELCWDCETRKRLKEIKEQAAALISTPL
jgi:ACT domain-containing protein/uncharacterized Zn finger protein (UPF0148 family)